LLVHACVWFVIKSDTVHGKSTEIIFKIIEFRVYTKEVGPTHKCDNGWIQGNHKSW